MPGCNNFKAIVFSYKLNVQLGHANLHFYLLISSTYLIIDIIMIFWLFSVICGRSVSAIAIDASQITSGTLTTTRGGTGLNTFTNQGVFYASSTSAMSQVSSSTEGHLLTINASGAPTFAHLSGGTF